MEAWEEQDTPWSRRVRAVADSLGKREGRVLLADIYYRQTRGVILSTAELASATPATTRTVRRARQRGYERGLLAPEMLSDPWPSGGGAP